MVDFIKEEFKIMRQMLIATRKSENDLCRLVSLAALCIDNK